MGSDIIPVVASSRVVTSKGVTGFSFTISPKTPSVGTGQIVKNIAQTAMNLNEGEGIAFYEFNEIDDEKAFKAKYRQALDEMPIDEATADKIVEEANAAFGMNMKMFQELEGNLIKAIGQMLFNTLTRRRSRGSTETGLATAD